MTVPPTQWRFDGRAASVALWLGIVAVLGRWAFGWGPLNFALLLSLAGLLLAGLRDARGALARHRWLPASAALLTGALFFHASEYVRYRSAPQADHYRLDIAVNTSSALVHWIDHGENPYATRNQHWHRVEGSRGVTQIHDATYMHGWRYRYGYPYFPGMLLSYAPFGTAHSAKPNFALANLLYLACAAAAAAGIGWAATHSATATLLAPALALAVPSLPIGAYLHGITDVAIGAWLAMAMLAVAMNRPVLAGVLLGAAQGCKLLPAPFFLLAAFVHFDARGRWPLLIAYLATAAGVLCPWLLADPESFLSATVLFYLTHHGAGDETALQWFLPAAVRPWMPILGAVAIGYAFLRCVPRLERGNPAQPALLGGVLTLLFLAFNGMFHLNYLWAAYPVLCAGFAASLEPPTKAPRERGDAPSA